MSSVSVVDVRVPLEALSFRFRKLQKHLQKAVDAEIITIINASSQGQQDYILSRQRVAALEKLIEESDIIERTCVSKMLYRASEFVSGMNVKVHK